MLHQPTLMRVPAPPRPTPQVARDKLTALGACIGRFTHSGKFRLTIGALDLLAQYAKYKVGGWAGNVRGGCRVGCIHSPAQQGVWRVSECWPAGTRDVWTAVCAGAPRCCLHRRRPLMLPL